MEVKRVSPESSFVDVFDRVLDKGIVIDAWIRLSLVGIDLVTVEARVVVASIATYLQFSEPLGRPPPCSRPGGSISRGRNRRPPARRARLPPGAVAARRVRRPAPICAKQIAPGEGRLRRGLASRRVECARREEEVKRKRSGRGGWL